MAKMTAKEKGNREFVRLCRLHRTAIEQAERATKAGHQSIAQGVLAEATRIHRELRKLLRGEKFGQLLQQRGQLVQRLHRAIAASGTEQGTDVTQLSGDLLNIDLQLEAV